MNAARRFGDAGNIAQEDFAAKVRALKSPACYPNSQNVVVTAIETHFAWVFLAGNDAYKLKKPIDYRGMDLRRAAARRASCAEELRLNRRLAPDVYVELVALVQREDGALRLGGAGMVIDWLVRMRRLPPDAALDRLLRSGNLPKKSLAAVGIRLAQFYRTQPGIAFEPAAYASRIAERIHDTRRELLAPELHLDHMLVQDAVTATRRAFHIVKDALAHRALENRIVEAHGDLRPEHIFLLDPPCVIDCLEFSKDLRTLDPVEELAFLCIECERAGNAQAGCEVLEAYRRASGDPADARLLDFYRSCRALVRGKVVAWHLCDPAVVKAAPWKQYAEDYLRLAERYARRVVAASVEQPIAG